MKGKKWINDIRIFAGLFIFAVMLVLLLKVYAGYLNYEKEAKAMGNSCAMETESIETESEEGLLLQTSESEQVIRICLRNSDYSEIVHQAVELTSDTSFVVTKYSEELLSEHSRETKKGKGQEETEGLQNQEERYEAGSTFYLEAADLEIGTIMRVCSYETKNDLYHGTGFAVNSIERDLGTPVYRGILYLCRTNDGMVLINELPLEWYLPSVVASEMPSSYPEEAQKAQAVCARTYAVNCIKNQNRKEDYEQILLEWMRSEEKEVRILYDLDDSVEFQVYNNQMATKQSRAAVAATEGVIMNREEALYYSTSAGTEHRRDLKKEENFAAFLEEEPEKDSEYGSPWLRWEMEVSESQILENLRKYERADLQKLTQIRILERNINGQVQQIELIGFEVLPETETEKTECAETEYIETEQNQNEVAEDPTGDTSVVVEGEYWIRKILGSGQAEIRLRNGKSVEGMTMVPSAFFVLESRTEPWRILISGGGYGHGIGMSQYGAAGMAERGYHFEEILSYYYDSDAM